MSKINKSKYVEFGPTITGTQTYYFPDLNDIRNANIWSMEFYSNWQINYTATGANPIDQNDVMQAYLTLYFKGGNFIVTPLANLITLRSADSSSNYPFAQYPFNLMGQVITWTKSYVSFGNPGGITAARNFVFNVNYTDSISG
jgi:hypothetical protein